MSLHKEIHFQTEICDDLAANGWLYDVGDGTKYDRARGLFPEDVLAPQQCDRLADHSGSVRGRTGQTIRPGTGSETRKVFLVMGLSRMEFLFDGYLMAI